MYKGFGNDRLCVCSRLESVRVCQKKYKREVIVITIERDNKRLLDIYKRGEEKER